MNTKQQFYIIIFILLLFGLFSFVFMGSQVMVLFHAFYITIIILSGVVIFENLRKEEKIKQQDLKQNSDLSAVNERLIELDISRAEFISIVSHQLRTPPTTIKWYLSAILSGDYGVLTDELKVAIEKAQIANEAQLNLIEDLLNTSRIERGKMEFNFVVSDLQKLCEQVFEQLKIQAQVKHLEFEFEKTEDKLPSICCDPEKIKQVVTNFCDNAIKYTRTGKIVVKVTKHEKNLVVSVKDTGAGLAPEHQKHLFEKYNHFAHGVGLGLFLAKVIIEKHHGKIWAESKGEGFGSTFNFSLPITTKQAIEHETVTFGAKLN